MVGWPPVFGQRVSVFGFRLFVSGITLSIAACGGNYSAGSGHYETAFHASPVAYDSAEDSFASWPRRAEIVDSYFEARHFDSKPLYHEQSMAATKASFSGLTPRIVTPRRPLQCVPYARRVSGIRLRGDAHTWWNSADGQFSRGHTPSPGAVMVVPSNRKNPLGHVAVVTKIINEREILVDHANWLNNERIHLATPVIDVSANNDWSSVRVWYTPGAQYGAHVYPLAGFIYPDTPTLYMTVTNANVRSHPSTRAKRIITLPRRSRVEVFGKVPGAPWYRIAVDGKELGYIYARLIKPTS